MASTRIHFRDVMWNTAWTFGVTFASGATTWAILKFADHYGGKPKNTFTAIISRALVAALPGVAVGYFLASRATILSFPYDQRVRTAYSLNVLGCFAFCTAAIKMFFDKKNDKAMFCMSVGTSFAFSFLCGLQQEGSGVLKTCSYWGPLSAYCLYLITEDTH
ncbi:MAG: hypothetical protein JSS10_09355 [Verrucomicrobia bacterium]|nr:hypothetical protein [Verrucomicrobiota bacterium]